MSIEFDDNLNLRSYAHPGRLVSTEWVARNLGRDGLVVVETDEDVLLYETGHIPGAVKLDWHTDLNDPVTRDFVDGARFAEVMSEKGISRDDTIVIYGDMSNWWAAYALWIFSLFGHEDVRLMNGGRAKWIEENREITRDGTLRAPTQYPVVQRDDSTLRAFKDDVFAHLGKPLIDVRSPEEYSGERTSAPHLPEEGALRNGHIPTARNVPWATAANEDGTFKSAEELHSIYQEQLGFSPDEPAIAYCRIGERSSHTWFVLKYLLGFTNVKNYDGSWTEWGSAVRAPIEKSSAPGSLQLA